MRRVRKIPSSSSAVEQLRHGDKIRVDGFGDRARFGGALGRRQLLLRWHRGAAVQHRLLLLHHDLLLLLLLLLCELLEVLPERDCANEDGLLHFEVESHSGRVNNKLESLRVFFDNRNCRINLVYL